MGIVVRLAQESDIARYLEMSQQCWHATGQAGAAKMRSRLRVNPKGVYAAESDGVVVGMVTTIRLSGYDVSKGMSWAETTADGWCTTHDPNGDVLFGVDLTTASEKPDGDLKQLFEAIGVHWGCSGFCSRCYRGDRQTSEPLLRCVATLPVTIGDATTRLRPFPAACNQGKS